MQFPVIESPLGDYIYLNGRLIGSGSEEANELKRPTDDIKYYETVRIKTGVLLFIEDHLLRLSKSVKGIEDFYVDTAFISDESKRFIRDIAFRGEGNLRIVLTKDKLVLHICEANIPSEECFEMGINTNILNWERVDPNLKVFRGDYKAAVADAFSREGAFGAPYEVLLTDRDNKIYEGSKSNFFAIIDGAVYSAADDKILIGITRNRVISSLNKVRVPLKTGTFTLEELKEKDAALFVSSTPFDILPITSVEGVVFNSVGNSILTQISREYRAITDKYISDNK